MPNNNYILKLLKQDLSHARDNRIRAEMSFRGLSPKQMQNKWCQSDNTCQEILDGYIKWEKKAKTEIQSIEGES